MDDSALHFFVYAGTVLLGLFLSMRGMCFFVARTKKQRNEERLRRIMKYAFRQNLQELK
jgi:hypothetical protein